MSLINKIKQDQLIARKNKDAAVASILTTLLGEASIIGKNNNRETTDDEVIATVKKFIKGVDEFLSLVNDEIVILSLIQERKVLEVYLPTQMTKESVEEQVGLLITSGLINKGLIMKQFKENYSGLYDGKVLAEIVDKNLSTK